MRSFLWSAGLVTALACSVACTSPTEGGGGDDDASTTSGTSTSSGAGGSSSGSTTGSGAGGQTPDNPIYERPSLKHRAVFGHYLGNYDLVGFQSANLMPMTPREPGAPTSGILGIAKHDVLAVALEGGDFVQVYDAATMTEVSGSPYATGYGPVDMAHDDARDRLYVYGIGTVGDPSKSLLSVYDTSSLPWQQLPGSPFDIDVAATRIDVDPITGAVFGVSFYTYWGVTIEDGVVTHLPESPQVLPVGVGADIAVDPERRRLYVGERVVGGDQRVHVLDVDQFTLDQRSPVTIPGSSLGDFALDPIDGDLWVVDFGSTKLHSIQADPLMLRDTCGTGGCFIPTTETGIALDHELDRLFIVHVPDLNSPDDGPGFLSVWDISDAAAPSEITSSGARPSLGTYPVTATAF
jgi:hypothetical protein